MRVTIDSDEMTRPYKDSNGNNKMARYQVAYLHEPGKRFPTSCELPLYDNARAWPKGDYETMQELEIGDFQRLRVKSEISLQPVAPAKG